MTISQCFFFKLEFKIWACSIYWNKYYRNKYIPIGSIFSELSFCFTSIFVRYVHIYMKAAIKFKIYIILFSSVTGKLVITISTSKPFEIQCGGSPKLVRLRALCLYDLYSLIKKLCKSSARAKVSKSSYVYILRLLIVKLQCYPNTTQEHFLWEQLHILVKPFLTTVKSAMSIYFNLLQLEKFFLTWTFSMLCARK